MGVIDVLSKRTESAEGWPAKTTKALQLRGAARNRGLWVSMLCLRVTTPSGLRLLQASNLGIFYGDLGVG